MSIEELENDQILALQFHVDGIIDWHPDPVKLLTEINELGSAIRSKAISLNSLEAENAKLRGAKGAAEELMAAALLREQFLRSQLAHMEAEADQLSEDGNKVAGGVVTLLDRIVSLQAENDRMLEGIRAIADLESETREYFDPDVAEQLWLTLQDALLKARALLEADQRAEPEPKEASWAWYSGTNQEVYEHGPFESRQEALEACDGYECAIYIIEATKPLLRLATAFDADTFLDGAEEAFEEDKSEDGECLFDITDNQKHDLERRVREAIEEWQTTHALSFTPFRFASTRNAERLIIFRSLLEGGE